MSPKVVLIFLPAPSPSPQKISFRPYFSGFQFLLSMKIPWKKKPLPYSVSFQILAHHQLSVNEDRLSAAES